MRIETLKHVPLKHVDTVIKGFKKDGAVRITIEKEDDEHDTVTAEFNDRATPPSEPAPA